MRILHLTPYYAPAYAFGGVVRSVEGMATSLVQRGHEVTVLTTDARDQQRRNLGALDETLDGVRVLRRPNVLPGLRRSLNLSTPRGMRKTAELILPEIDVLHVHEFRTLENLLVTPVAQRLGKPIIMSPHGTLNLATGRGGLKSAWDRLLSPGIALRIDHVIALTETELKRSKSFVERLRHKANSRPNSASYPTALFWATMTRRAWLPTFANASSLATRRLCYSWAACMRERASMC